MFNGRLGLLCHIHIGIWRLLQNRRGIVTIRDYLWTSIAPTIHINREVARNPKEPAREGTTLRLIRIGALPNAPECFLQYILRRGAIAHDLEREPKHSGSVTVIESFKRSVIASGCL